MNKEGNRRSENERETAGASCFLGMMLGGMVSLTPIGIVIGGAAGYKAGQLIARFGESSRPPSKPPSRPNFDSPSSQPQHKPPPSPN
jgi:hypothetical protein